LGIMPTRLLVLAAAIVLGGCTSVPEVVKTAPPGDVHVGEVRNDPTRFVGTVVRWGGSVEAVRNERDATLIEVVARSLDSSGRPRDEDKSEGRFLAKVAGFLDPAIYAQGREVTVRGQVTGVHEDKIGDFHYLYPIVTVEHLHLWAPRPPPLPPYPYYDPFWWGPGYPWGWPYYPPYRY
jgi:outer membrane lipoprotein